MDGVIGAVIFIVVVILSLAQKFQEQKRTAERKRQQAPKTVLPETTRRILYGEPAVAKEARPRDAAPPPAQPARQAPRQATPQQQPPSPKTLARELMEALSGVEQPTVPPPPLPPPTPQPVRTAQAPRTMRRRQAPQQAHTTRRAPTQQRAPQPTRREKHRHEIREEKKRAAARAQQRTQKRAPQRAAARTPLLRFKNMNDVRRAIALAEILKPPKAFENL